MRNPVGWFEIYVDDIERAKTFYENVLATSLTPLTVPGDEAQMMTFPMNPEANGSSGALIKMGMDDRPRGNGVLIYFSCEDCGVEGSRVEANGGSIFKEKFSIG